MLQKITCNISMTTFVLTHREGCFYIQRNRSYQFSGVNFKSWIRNFYMKIRVLYVKRPKNQNGSKMKTKTDPDWLILANQIRATRSAISIDTEINPDWLV